MRGGGPLHQTGDGRLFGVYYAIVTQNKDDQNMARCKVRFPWLDQGDTDQSWWALCSTPMAGTEFGWYTLPDVGDVVAVMFIAGDISRPVILGGVWSKTDVPPEKNEGENEFRGYRSRTGCRFILDDSDQKKIVLADKTDGNAVVVGSFQKGGSGAQARAGEGGTAINGGKTEGVSISSKEGKVEIYAKGKLKVEAKNVELDSKGGFDLSGGNTTLDGKIGMLNGGGSAKLEGATTKVG
jgi:uncharacterized protein involved in type VI secretion and phage assembly